VASSPGRPFRTCSTCGKRALLDEGSSTCDACLAHRLVNELAAVDIMLMKAGWDRRNSPVGTLLANTVFPTPRVKGDTLGMPREVFLEKLLECVPVGAPLLDFSLLEFPASARQSE
jgi:hypothetical protein